MALASKQAELARVEEAKRQEAQMGQYCIFIFILFWFYDQSGTMRFVIESYYETNDCGIKQYDRSNGWYFIMHLNE